MLQAKNIRFSEAQELAILTISAIEGALIMCRALRNTEPLRTVQIKLRKQLEEALSHHLLHDQQ